MKISIQSLTLTNFKCFRMKHFDFVDDVMTIRGRNGSGKTTIADAILFCLFGKTVEGQSDLELFKTREDGMVIPNLEHSVELTLSVVDGQTVERTVSLKRSIKEVWVKKRGSDESVLKNNTVEYYINGESQTKGDYEKYIASIVDERIFRTITSPTYFPSLKWQDQRALLTSMTSDIRPSCDGSAELQQLLLELSNYEDDVAAYLKHLKYQIKGVKDKLDKIPVRLEEQHKALPELLDWALLARKRDETGLIIKDLDAKILQIKAGNGADVRKEQLRDALDTLYEQKRIVEEQLRKPLYEQRTANAAAIADASRQFNALLNNQRDLEASMRSFDTLSERCKETLAQCERDAEQIRKEWSANLSRTLTWSDDDDVCPTCGQPLPQEQLSERYQHAVERLNKSKADTKALLTERANKVKALRSQADEQLKDYALRKEDAEKQLVQTKQDINEVFATKQDLEKTVIPSLEEVLQGDAKYQGIIKSISDVKEQLKSASVTTDEDQQALTALEDERREYVSQSQQIQTQLSTRSQYDRISALIEGINGEEKDLVAQLSELEKKEDTARDYQVRENQLLEEHLNRHFKLVKWRLFRTVNNGGDSYQEPYCEAYVGGIPYHGGLNQAARLNAGLDICEALCTYYDTYAPIVIDNAEAVNEIYKTTGQQIRMYVSEDERLVVESER